MQPWESTHYVTNDGEEVVSICTLVAWKPQFEPYESQFIHIHNAVIYMRNTVQYPITSINIIKVFFQNPVPFSYIENILYITPNLLFQIWYSVIGWNCGIYEWRYIQIQMSTHPLLVVKLISSSYRWFCRLQTHARTPSRVVAGIRVRNNPDTARSIAWIMAAAIKEFFDKIGRALGLSRTKDLSIFQKKKLLHEFNVFYGKCTMQTNVVIFHIIFWFCMFNKKNREYNVILKYNICALCFNRIN